MNIEEIKKAVELCKQYESPLKPQWQMLIDLAEKVIELQGVMPEKKTYQNTKEWMNGGAHFSKGFNEAIDLCTLAMAGKEVSVEGIYQICISQLNNKWIQGDTYRQQAIRGEYQQLFNDIAQAIHKRIYGGE